LLLIIIAIRSSSGETAQQPLSPYKRSRREIVNSNYYCLLLLCLALFLSACSSDRQDSNAAATPPESNEDVNSLLVDTNSLATNGCQNVVILNDFAYAACGNGIEIVDLNSTERDFFAVPANDISGDADLGLLFTQSGNTLTQLDIANPMEPNVLTTVNTNFSLFSGISAAKGIVVVSADSGGSDTEVYSYDATSLSLIISGIAVVDSRTGNPDVHVAATDGGALAFYSQDLGAVANWGIQIVEFDSVGNILSLPDFVELTPGLFTGSFGSPFGPANFPLESEYLDNRLYSAHFAARGVQVIDRSDSDRLSLIPLGYEPTNIATDGSNLFVVSVNRDTVDIIDPISATVMETITLPLQQPVGVAASATHIAVADRSIGLVVFQR